MPKPPWIVATAWLAIAAPAPAQAPGPQLAGLAFLVGDWVAGRGQVADTGGTSTGRSTITLEVGGNVLLRRDHTDLFSAAGKSTGGFDQIMMIYPEGNTICADYSDGTHVIHYRTADVAPGRSVTFTSASQPNAPTFRLRYDLTDPRTLTVAFQMAPPGSSTFQPIATGKISKVK